MAVCFFVHRPVQWNFFTFPIRKNVVFCRKLLAFFLYIEYNYLCSNFGR